MTDADLVLGRINAGRFLGGKMGLDVGRRRARDRSEGRASRWASA